MNNLTIRPCREEDITMVCAIETACFSVPWSKESFMSALQSAETALLVLTEGETILGFGCVIAAAGEGEILNIAVSPEQRQKGYGRTLLKALLAEAEERQAERIFLEVRESNSPARHLYEASGFVPIGIRKNYYSKPTENAVCMCRVSQGTGNVL